MNEIVEYSTFKAFVTTITGGVAGIWALYDVRNLLVLRGKPGGKADPLVHDKRFGYAIGILIGIVGVVGSLMFYDVL